MRNLLAVVWSAARNKAEPSWQFLRRFLCMARRVGRTETRFIASLFEVPQEGTSRSLEEFLARIVQRCADWFGATTVSLFLVDDQPGWMSLAATGGEFNTIPKLAKIQFGKGIAGIAAQDGSPVLINELSERGKFGSMFGKGANALVSSMVVPLKTTSGAIGVLNLSRRVGLERFSEADLRLARSVASHLGLAVENARLVSRLQSTVAELEGERAKFRGIFNGLGLAAFLLDRQGRTLEANPAAQDLAFLPSRDKLRRPAERCVMDLKDQVTGRSWLAVLNPLPGGMSTLIMEETTERERQRQELDRLNRLAEIGQMTAAIAHEIRNPLTGIKSAAQMIRMAPEEAEEFTQIIEHEAMKLNELCNEFLSFARPVELVTRPFSLSGVVERVCKLMGPEFEANGVRLDVEIGEHLPIIEGDPLRWEQVLQNLMLNALQASKAGGRVTVGLNEAEIWVEDDGCGMSEEQTSRLFTPFFTTKPQGTGLGLSTVKKILDAHKSSISVSSRPQRGTRFQIDFRNRRAA